MGSIRKRGFKFQAQVRREGAKPISKTFTLKKDAEVWVSAADSKVDILQHGSGQHTAYIDVSGMYGTDVQLEQNSSTAQSYSLTQYCTNPSGCGVSVIQN